MGMATASLLNKCVLRLSAAVTLELAGKAEFAHVMKVDSPPLIQPSSVTRRRSVAPRTRSPRPVSYRVLPCLRTERPHPLGKALVRSIWTSHTRMLHPKPVSTTRLAKLQLGVPRAPTWWPSDVALT